MRTDIFDKIMELPGLRFFKPFYKKHKEVLLYLFFGFCTSLISIISYAVSNITFGINALIANLIAWVLSVLFAFFTNRVWVFQSKTNTARAFLIQMLRFFGGRVVTVVIEEVIIFIFITLLGLNSILIKIVAQVVVILLNYIISKLWVFRNQI